MSATRDSPGREVMGWLEGGYQTLIDALSERIRALGGEIHAGTPSSGSPARPSGATGLVVDGDASRPSTPCSARCAAAWHGVCWRRSSPSARPTDHCRYLGVVCALLRVTRSVSPYYHAEHHRPARSR